LSHLPIVEDRNKRITYSAEPQSGLFQRNQKISKKLLLRWCVGVTPPTPLVQIQKSFLGLFYKRALLPFTTPAAAAAGGRRVR
jgi:hypothetical protein